MYTEREQRESESSKLEKLLIFVCLFVCCFQCVAFSLSLQSPHNSFSIPFYAFILLALLSFFSSFIRLFHYNTKDVYTKVAAVNNSFNGLLFFLLSFFTFLFDVFFRYSFKCIHLFVGFFASFCNFGLIQIFSFSKFFFAILH